MSPTLRCGGRALLLLAGFAALALAVYAPALHGPFLSDDLAYLPRNPYVHALGGANLRAFLDPRAAPAGMLANYAPLHLLLLALEWHAFGADTTGYHLTSLLLHAAVSLLFLLWLHRSGLPGRWALAGAALFLLHPANVEAVAWISQLKSTAGLALALAALLVQPARPAAACGLYVASLLTKASALFALPVAATRTWLVGGREAGERPTPVRAWSWLAVWTLASVAFAALQLAANRHADAEAAPALHPDPWIRLRTVVVIAGRYLAMAASGLGTSAFHEPAPVLAPLDPRFLLSLLVLLVLASRAGWALRARRSEALGWVWAAAAFAPVSQVIPFEYPMADRYLYFVLPGLLAAVLHALHAARGSEPVDLSTRPTLRRVGDAGLIALLGLLLLGFGLRAHARAGVWTSAERLLEDAAAHYPDGVSAHLLVAAREARAGRPALAVEALRGAYQRGYVRFEQLAADPDLAPLREEPAFRALLIEMAGVWVDRVEAMPAPSQTELEILAQAHLLRGETGAALRALERGLERGGPLDDTLRAEHAEIWRRLGEARSRP